MVIEMEKKHYREKRNDITVKMKLIFIPKQYTY